MGLADVVTKEYMREPHVFADAFNFLLYDGRQVIKPSELREMDTSEVMYAYGSGASGKGTGISLQKYRDVLKCMTIMSGSEASYVLMGVENQTDIHYAMPVRNMVYDALQYADQVSKVSAVHRRDRGTETKAMSSAEFLSGFTRADRLQPVITLVVHFGADPWDGPMSLHEMFSVQNDTIRRYAQDYRLHLLDPGRIPQKEFKKFASSLREVLNYIKYSKDEKGLARLLAEDERLKALEAGAARVIETITHTDFAIDEKTEVVNVCQAVEDMMKTREQKGWKQGEEIGRKYGEEIGRKQGQQQGSLNTLIQLVRKGLLSVADAASEAGLSREAFEQQMKTQKF